MPPNKPTLLPEQSHSLCGGDRNIQPEHLLCHSVQSKKSIMDASLRFASFSMTAWNHSVQSKKSIMDASLPFTSFSMTVWNHSVQSKKSIIDASLPFTSFSMTAWNHSVQSKKSIMDASLRFASFSMTAWNHSVQSKKSIMDASLRTVFSAHNFKSSSNCVSCFTFSETLTSCLYGLVISYCKGQWH
jgi:hypothetical protein